MDEYDNDKWIGMFTEYGFDRPRIPSGVDLGWWPLLELLLLDLRTMGFSKETLQIQQVKEKFGGLRFYVYIPEVEGTTEIQRYAHTRIAVAERESYRTCESCGMPGTLREGRWLKTLCDTHADGRPTTTLE